MKPQNINGIPVLVSPVVPEFKPALRMSPCGCSDTCLQDFNRWLLERFGQRREILIVGGHIVVHPGTYHYIRGALPLWDGGAL